MKEAKFVKSLTVSFEKKIYDQINKLTDARCISMAEWVRKAVENHLDKTATEIQNGFERRNEK